MTRSSDLIERARSETALHDFGEGAFREGLDRLVASANEHTRFTENGRAVFERQIVNFLSRRLKVEHWYTLHPEIDEEQIVAPLIGMGLPRTGSTALPACWLKIPRRAAFAIGSAMLPAHPPKARPSTAIRG